MVSLPGSDQVKLVGFAVGLLGEMEVRVVMSFWSPVFCDLVHAEIMGGNSSLGSVGVAVILATFSLMTFSLVDFVT